MTYTDRAGRVRENFLFVTEVEYEDNLGNVEVREVVTKMRSAEAVAKAEAAYAAGNISHERAVEIATQ